MLVDPRVRVQNSVLGSKRRRGRGRASSSQGGAQVGNPCSDGMLFDVKKSTARRSIERSSYRPTLQLVARSIYERHPTEYQRRDCSLSTVEKKLEAILKHKRLPEEKCAAYLLQIDRNHAGLCASAEWQKDNSQFARALENYLAPTKERYDVEPTASARRTEPGRLMA